MNKKRLRERLKKLDVYVKKLDFQSTFLEESAVVGMDSLIISLKMGEELSIDISCNYVEVPDVGSILQFYGQLMLNEVFDNAGVVLTEQELLYLVNELNSMLPVGQFIYLSSLEANDGKKAAGLRYTMLTELDQDSEFAKCTRVLMMLMKDYELLCSALMLLLDGDSVEEALETIRQVLEEED